MVEINIKKKLFAFELNIDIKFESGQLASIYGESGAGKTTLLRLLAGLDCPDDGIIKVDNQIWFSSKDKIFLPPQKRQVSLVFQDYALFPNMSVRENVEFALYFKKDKKFVDELLHLVNLKPHENQKIRILSGGQKQRLALIRAIARKPKILLLDEPLSALDFKMRATLQEELLHLHKTFNITTLMVSHELSEVAKLSNIVYVIKSGKVVKSGKVSDVFKIDNSKINIFGSILDIVYSDVIAIVKVLVGNEVVSFPVSKKEVSDLATGDKILISAKAFNFLIQKIIN